MEVKVMFTAYLKVVIQKRFGKKKSASWRMGMTNFNNLTCKA
jgi:hypothetical protein